MNEMISRSNSDKQ